MLKEELIYRILRLNLVDAPRVIIPGPRTEFPILFHGPPAERFVYSLEEAREISKGTAGVPGEAGKGFFTEAVPIEKSLKVGVRGLKAYFVGAERRDALLDPLDSILDLAVRAAYCLHLDEALVTVGLGPGGPRVLEVSAPEATMSPGWVGEKDLADTVAVDAAGGCRADNVHDACEGASHPEVCGESFSFLGARVEFVKVNSTTGTLFPRIFAVDFYPGSIAGASFGQQNMTQDMPKDGPEIPDVSLGLAADAKRCHDTWISSPLPFPDVPLSTRLIFSGRASSGFLRALDNSIALAGMLLSPVEEARVRHATSEGLLGSYRAVDVTGSSPDAFSGSDLRQFLASISNAGEAATATKSATGGVPPVFEYLSVPSLLWNPRGLLGIMALSDLIASEWEILREVRWLQGPWDLEEIHAWQKAYYGVRKRYFARRVDLLWELYRSLPSYKKHEEVLDELYLLLKDETKQDADTLGKTSALDPASDDFRCAWGIRLATVRRPCLLLPREYSAQGLFGHVLPPVEIKAGSRKIRVPQDSFLVPGAGYDAENDGGVEPEIEVEDDELEGDFFPRIGLNHVLANLLSIPRDMRYRWKVVPEGSRSPSQGRYCLNLGPVLGIAAKEKVTELDRQGRFGIETDRFTYISELGRMAGILVYVFFPDKVDWQAGLLDAWLYREKAGWQRRRLPFPDVVYDRYISNETGQNEVLEFVRKCPEVVLINSIPFSEACKDKLLSYEILSQDPVCAGHLPHTEKARAPGMVLGLLDRHGQVYLKPRYGSGSRGLVFLEKREDEDIYLVQRKEGSMGEEIILRGRSTVGNLVESILRESLRTPGMGGYIVQQGICPARATGGLWGTLEIRVIYQKGGAGRWLRTGMVARVNPGRERFILPGEEIHLRVDEILQTIFPGKAGEIKEDIRKISRRIPPLLEAAQGPGGEISVDLIVDKTGKPWVLEVNSKPATFFRDIGAFGLRRLSIIRILNYSWYLWSRGTPRGTG